VKPLRRELKTLKAWITGQRKDQSPGTRNAVPVVEVDPVFEGVEGGPGSLIKYNPLSNLTSAEVRPRCGSGLGVHVGVDVGGGLGGWVWMWVCV
jgi:hypothetical protein